MSDPAASWAFVRRLRRGLGSVRRAPSRRARSCTVAGIEVQVPRGVRHPLADGGAAFFLRTVGPMIAPGHRVLVWQAGCGHGVLVAATRGADVVVVPSDEASARAIAANAEAHSVAERVRVVRDPEGPFDLVLCERDPLPVDRLEDWLGDRGRAVALERIDRPSSAPPAGYRRVKLAQSPGVFAPFRTTSLGWDRERAREERHAARGSEDRSRRAKVSRKRWEASSREPPTVEEAANP